MKLQSIEKLHYYEFAKLHYNEYLEFMSVGKRIEEIRLSKGWTQKDLAHRLGKEPSYISRFESDEFKNPTKETIEKFAKALEVPVESLFGNTKRDDYALRELSRGKRPAGALDAPDYKPHDIPVVGIVQAGRGRFFDEQGRPSGDWPEKVHRPEDVKDPDAYAVKVDGDSMLPALKKGNYVVCVTDKEPQPGDWVVVQMKDDEMMVKELHVKDGMIVLESVNPLHEPVVLHKKDVRAIHPIVWIKRK